MTEAEKLGYKEGDLFTVIYEHIFKLGSLVRLVRDDGSNHPGFEAVNPSDNEFIHAFKIGYTKLDRVRKVADAGSYSLGEEPEAVGIKPVTIELTVHNPEQVKNLYSLFNYRPLAEFIREEVGINTWEVKDKINAQYNAFGELGNIESYIQSADS